MIDVGFAAFGQLQVGCNSLTLTQIARCAHLRSVSLAALRGLRDHAFAALQSLQLLEACELSWLELSDTSLAVVAQWPGLTVLTLRMLGCVTDAGIAQLSQLKRLRTLRMLECYRVSSSGVAALATAMPGLTTHHD